MILLQDEERDIILWQMIWCLNMKSRDMIYLHTMLWGDDTGHYLVHADNLLWCDMTTHMKSKLTVGHKVKEKGIMKIECLYRQPDNIRCKRDRSELTCQ